MLKIGNVNVDELVKKYQTPLYVYDEQKIISVINEYKKYLRSLNYKTKILYAAKAFECLHIFDLVNKNGLCLDVVTGGELYGANLASFNMDNVFFHGNNKTIDEMELAIKYHVKNIVIDNKAELMEWLRLTDHINYKINVLLRINIGVSAHTHEYVITSHPDSKFGFYIESQEIKEVIDLLRTSEKLEFVGFNSHIGSQIFDMEAYMLSIEKVLDLAQRLKADIKYLDLGGGFGIRYTDDDRPLSFEYICQMLTNKVDSELAKRNMSIDYLLIEPGRSIVAEAGYTLYTINKVKKAWHKTYYFIDGGMADNIRPALYQAKYSCDIANKMDQEKTNTVSIAGKCCESADVIIDDVKLPLAQQNDILVVYSTGAYGSSMASNYNKLPKLPIVFVNGDNDILAVKRETYADLYQHDVREEK